MSNTTRERLLKQNAKLIRTKRVEVDTGEGEKLIVEVRSPTLGQTATFTEDQATPAGRMRGLVRMVIATTFEAESGNPVFTLADEDLLLQAPASGGWITDLINAVGSLGDESVASAKN